jgi:hypothetical protein
MDWGYHGGNRKKGVETIEEKAAVGKCELCDEEDSLQHIIWGCVHGDMQDIRDQISVELNTYVASLRGLSEIECQLGEAIRDLALDGGYDSYLVWLSHWTLKLRGRLLDRCPRLREQWNDESIRALKKVATKIGKLLAEGVRELWQYHRTSAKSETGLFKRFDKRRKKRLAKTNGRSGKGTQKTAVQELATSRRQQSTLEAKKRRMNAEPLQRNRITATMRPLNDEDIKKSEDRRRKLDDKFKKILSAGNKVTPISKEKVNENKQKIADDEDIKVAAPISKAAKKQAKKQKRDEDEENKLVPFLDVMTVEMDDIRPVGEWEAINDSLPLRRRKRLREQEMEIMRMKLKEQEGEINIQSGSDADEVGTDSTHNEIRINREKKQRNEGVQIDIDFRSRSCISKDKCVASVVNNISSSQELVRGKLG